MRLSSVRAFVTPVARRKNLHVAINAVVTKISINKGNRATGIEMRMVRPAVEFIVSMIAYSTYEIFHFDDTVLHRGGMCIESR